MPSNWGLAWCVCTLALVAEENRRRVLQRAAACAGRALRFVTKKVGSLSAALVSLSDSVLVSVLTVHVSPPGLGLGKSTGFLLAHVPRLVCVFALAVFYVWFIGHSAASLCAAGR